MLTMGMIPSRLLWPSQNWIEPKTVKTPLCSGTFYAEALFGLEAHPAAESL